MGKVIQIAPKKIPDWRDSPLMQDMMAQDRIKFDKVLKKHNQKVKKKIS